MTAFETFVHKVLKPIREITAINISGEDRVRLTVDLSGIQTNWVQRQLDLAIAIIVTRYPAAGVCVEAANNNYAGAEPQTGGPTIVATVEGEEK